MFNDLFVEGATESFGQLQLNSAFDYSEFASYLKETDSTIDGLIASYRGVMTEALQESAGVMNESVTLVLEQANGHVGNKIVAALKKLWAFIVRIVDQSVNFISTLITSNKKFIEKIKPEVEKKGLTSEDLAKITMTSYNYKPGIIAGEKIKTVLGDVDAEARSMYDKDNKDKLDKVVESYNENKRRSVSYEKIEIANRLINGASIHEEKDWGRYKDELRIAMQGGEKKTTKTFSMDYFKTIESYSGNAEQIKKSMDSSKAAFKNTIDSIINKAGLAKAEGKGEGADAKFASGKVAYLNFLRSRTAAAADTFAELLSMKLTIVKRELAEARAFCMYAHRYNKSGEKKAGDNKAASGAAPAAGSTGSTALALKNESAAVIPFDPLFEDAEDLSFEPLAEGDQGGSTNEPFLF